MDFRIISLPPFKAASSGIDKEFNFSPDGILGKFNKYFSAINLSEFWYFRTGYPSKSLWYGTYYYTTRDYKSTRMGTNGSVYTH